MCVCVCVCVCVFYELIVAFRNYAHASNSSSKNAQPITVFICALPNDAVGQVIGKCWIMNGKRCERRGRDVI